MPRPAAAPARASVPTPERILDAAVIEFAERGLAGARVDRIAERAEANKQRIYAYFGGKEALFDRVVTTGIAELLDAVPFDPDDLPGYAVRLFEFNRTHPELVRLLLWHTLERPGLLGTLENATVSTSAKVEALAAAQAAAPDRIDPGVPADRLLGQVLALVHGATLGLGPAPVGGGGTALATLHADLRRSVERIVAP